ncbi:mechanosensitive ion channel [Shewanella algae]|uniref:mechanosensitive ion channel domain-containing protein n=1 Tax=Shewanella algae TaxID=38313 RepID=UPI0020351957|nr:mechanosensitive ion channel domain-containing protein [Shewanella algae]MCM2529000.1 mechanosensitive ion channel [Shewanella algae]
MVRACLLLFCLFIASAQANSPLGLDKRLGLNQQNTETLSQEQQLAQLEKSIQQLADTNRSYQELQLNFESRRQHLYDQLQEAAAPLKPELHQDLDQQASMAYLRLSELKESETNLSQANSAMLKRHSELPAEIVKIRQALLQQQKAQAVATDNAAKELQQAQLLLLEQQLTTLESELAVSQQKRELHQLQLQLVRKQLQQQELLIEQLNRAITDARQQQVNATLAETLNAEADGRDRLTTELSLANQRYGQQLQLLTEQTAQTIALQEQAEKLDQSHSKQLDNIKEQISWVKMNPVFGERFLQILQSLPKPPNQEHLQTQIADARLNRYQIEQQFAANEQLLTTQAYSNESQLRLLESQQALLNQLLKGYDTYLSELAKLKSKYELLTDSYQRLKSTLNEHLFWVPNAYSISKLWLTDLQRSSLWLWQQTSLPEIKQGLTALSPYWSWWIILVVLCLVAQDILTPRFKTMMRECEAPVGKVTQDKFIYTIQTLVISAGYSLFKPFPIVAAGLIMLQSDSNPIQAIGMGVLAIGSLYQLYRFIYLLALDKGLLIGHFKRPQEVIRQGQQRFRRFVIMAMPLVGVMGFTEILDSSLVRNSIGRGAFILFCIMLFMLYRDVLTLSRRYRESHLDDKNKRLLQKLLWLLLLLVPPLSAVLAFRGYYFTAFQMLLQLQLSLLLGLGFLLLYQLLKRWMLIERRRIAFDRAKARRAERLAQREKGDTSSGTNDHQDTYEEPVVDLETMSSQSLGLVRSLLLLAFLACLVGLWTQTHTALFSFLDGITLWTTTTTGVGGVEQPLPITMKSLVFGAIVVGFSMMIATNLPGLLELTVLQKLDLTPGTGFAITTVTRYLVVFIGIVIGFATLGMEWSKLQWLIAALTLGLGFGLQEIFANFISGLIILFEKPVRIGDTVTIRELTGTVSKIKIRATTIIDWDRKEIIIPNKAFITEQLINWSLSDPITRVIIYVSVARDSDPARVEAALYQAVKECENALETPEPEVWFAGFGKHTQDYEVRAYAKDMSSRWPLRHDLHKRISKKLKENQLELAYPQLEVHISNTHNKDTSGIIRG